MYRNHFAAGAVLTVGVITALTGCVPSPGAAYSAAARQAVTELADLDAEAVEQAVLERASAAEADIWKLSGLDEEFGGADATSALLRAALTPTLDWVADERAQPSTMVLVSAAWSPAFTATTLGVGFMAVDAVTDAAVDQTNDGTSGAQTGQAPDGRVGVSVGEDGAVHADYSSTSTVSNAELTVTAGSDLNPCPAPDGRFEMSADVAVRLESGGRGASIEMHVDATGLLDDDANLVGTNYEYRQQFASYADGAGEFLDHSGNAAGDVTVNRNSDAVTTDFITGAAVSAALLAHMVADNLQTAAEKGWSSGRCVTLDLTPSDGPDGLEPGGNVTIDAAPRSTVDGLPTGGNLVGTLEGQGALDPTGSRLDAPATLRFTAPSERDQTGTITVESRSNRGIGTATLSLSTGERAYAASGGRVEYSGSGTICSLSAPFTIPGNTVTFTFSPSDKSGGTWKASGGLMDLIFEGSGSYTVVYSDDNVATVLALEGTVATIAPDGSRFPGPGDLEFSLTPTEACS